MASMGKAMMGTGEADGEGRAIKAAEMAISNPLIDDYTLKGAKGLLVNITGGSDLKLFEVDEAVNKVRAEVDPEAELIIGAIKDTNLDGKMRVSIVATSLDGQQPEAKSVINMVHRIQNRNPGYSDFSNSSPTFNFASTTNNPISHGANALKLENEIVTNNLDTGSSSNSINELNEEYNSELVTNQNNKIEDFVDNDSVTEHEQSFTEEVLENTKDNKESLNGLENFGLEEESLELFNSENELSSEKELSSEDNNDQLIEDDDLEIPAFLRRQKN
jgi:cell division protein FtsZ